MSYARIIVFALALTHTVGLADLVVEDACEEACSDDGCGDCAPGVACRCHCPSAMPLLGHKAQAAVVLAPPSDVEPPADAHQMPASPDPREILHVPRHAV